MVTNQQLYLLIGIPMLVNATLIGVLMAYVNARINALQSNMDARFNGVDQRFNGVDQRFDDLRDLWRAELHRVEEVLDARLKHLEER